MKELGPDPHMPRGAAFEVLRDGKEVQVAVPTVVAGDIVPCCDQSDDRAGWGVRRRRLERERRCWRQDGWRPGVWKESFWNCFWIVQVLLLLCKPIASILDSNGVDGSPCSFSSSKPCTVANSIYNIYIDGTQTPPTHPASNPALPSTTKIP